MTPTWSAHRYSDADRAAVLDMYTEPDFFFRTVEPDTLAEHEIVERLADDTRVLLADGAPVGLYAIEAPPMGRDHYSHVNLHLRLRSGVPLDWWVQAYREVVQSVRRYTEVVRLAALFGEFDERGLAAARASGMTEEGTLAGVVVHGGRRSGFVYFSQIWAVQQ